MKDEITKYKFVVFPGNNPKVIQEALAKRKLWIQLPQDKLLNSNFIWKPLNFSSSFCRDVDEILTSYKNKNIFLNHFENNNLIGSKSNLLRSLKYYYSHDAYDRNMNVFQVIPTTFIVHTHRDQVEFRAFYERFDELQKKKFLKEKVPEKHCQHNIWFIKPESQNQGRGITLTNNLKEIQNFIFSKMKSGWIIQKAIERPLLYKNRKFDIRVWVLVSQNFDIYYYNQPYIRTSSTDYETTNFKIQIHLTNNSQQKKAEDYSKHQKGNIISFAEFQNYLKSQEEYTENSSIIMENIHERMKKIILDVFLGVKRYFCKNSIKKEFELFGFDFLLDEDFRVWLLEANANPFLGTPNDHIRDILPKMIDEMFQIVLDPYFPPQQYEKVVDPQFQLLFKQIGVGRISQNRSGSTQPVRRKKFYPLRLGQKGENPVSTTKRSRRNSQAVTVSGQSSEQYRNRLFKAQTPLQSIKYLLETYCFADLQPFVHPTNLFLNSLARNVPFTDESQLTQAIRNLKLVVDTRIAHVLLERKVAFNVIEIFSHSKVDFMIKAQLLNGLGLAAKNTKQKQVVISLYVNTLQRICYEDGLKISRGSGGKGKSSNNLPKRQEERKEETLEQKFEEKKDERKEENSEYNFEYNSEQKPEQKSSQRFKKVESSESFHPLQKVKRDLPEIFLDSLMKLLIKLGGTVDRKIFIPGESRQNEQHRDLFIRSLTMKFMMDLNEVYPQVQQAEVQQFLKTLSQKDWGVYENSKKEKMNIFVEDIVMTESDMLSSLNFTSNINSKYNSTKMGSFNSMYDSNIGSLGSSKATTDRADRKRKTSFREANEFKNIQMFTKSNKKVEFPRIEKKNSYNESSFK